MNIATILARPRPISPEYIKAFRAEQRCSVQFAKLPVVRRQLGKIDLDLLLLLVCAATGLFSLVVLYQFVILFVRS